MPRSALFRAVVLFSVACSATAFGSQPEPGRHLSFPERVEAQRAIERVYYFHQVAVTQPFEQVVRPGLVEAKVRKYLKQSVALEEYWRSAVSPESLRRELERVARNTRFPERLREIYAALRNDPLLIQECFARPLLVDRLVRSFFEGDPRFGGDLAGPGPADSAAKQKALDAWWSAAAGRLDETRVETVASADSPLPEPTGVESACIPDDTWSAGLLSDAPLARSQSASVWTGSLLLVWGGQGEAGTQPDSGNRYDPLTDGWEAMTRVGSPGPRVAATAVWTGSRMIVWGGKWNMASLDTGAQYDPVSDDWISMTSMGAPDPRVNHTAVWTGGEMIVWGGETATAPGEFLADGGRYDPLQDRWHRVSDVKAPEARAFHTAVWTGSRMIVWGGEGVAGALGSGALYDPASNSWDPASPAGAPSARLRHTVVWTGSRMIVWGGESASGALSSGGAYDPVANLWTPTALSGVPRQRTSHSAVWTGTRMIVWGGADGATPLRTGGLYDPASDSWTPASTFFALEAPRFNHVAAWTGSLMLVWGGTSTGPLMSGGRYDPASNTWTRTSIGSGPSPRRGHHAFWTGSLMIVWGGSDTSGVLDTGGRYDPLADSWSPTSLGDAVGSGAVSVWTGTHMIVWGGFADYCVPGTGGRYEPISDTWTSISTTGAPMPRVSHTGVWTGSELIVWGGREGPAGCGGQFSLNDGGRYDPVTDTWSLVSQSGAPEPRNNHTAVWTGSLMIVWGGVGLSGYYLDTGGWYDPTTDTWSLLSHSGAPEPRNDHTAVWTGSLMIVWGGAGLSGAYLDTGGRYDPATDSWSPTSVTGAPTPRYGEGAVWTGSRLIIWGGSSLNDGAKYDPVLDVWEPMTPVDSLEPRHYHSTVWTGSSVVIWGGSWGNLIRGDGSSYALGHGADDDGDGVAECGGDCNDANPSVRPGAPEICDGYDSDCDGLLDPGEADADGDGYRGCEGDCNDSDAGAHAAPSAIIGLDVADAGVGGILIIWEDQGPFTGSGIRYDAFAGDASALVQTGGDFSTGACLVDNRSSPFLEILSPSLPPGKAAYFMIRAQNSCGAATYGGVNRDATAALSGTPCD